MKNIKPPKKLSQAIMLALHDLEKVEKDPRYKVDMTIWHESCQSREWWICSSCYRRLEGVCG